MFQIFYNILWFLALILLSPIYLYRVIAQGKYRASTLARLGFQNIPMLQDKKVIWLHSVSLGESQISDQFAHELKIKYPKVYIVASSCTETGQAVLKDCKAIDFSFYYPADVFSLVRNIFKRINPQAIIIVETDLWPNMLKQADKRDVPVFLINAKISESTFNVYKKLPAINHMLLDSIEHFFIQCKTYDERFDSLEVEDQRRSLSGNLKLDRRYFKKSEKQLDILADKFGLNRQSPILVFASTHDSEEQGFINVVKLLRNKIPDLQVVLVPRHPERFNEVADLLVKSGIAFNSSSKMNDVENDVKSDDKADPCSTLLVDQMGILMGFYALSTVSVVAGSFTDKVGGHNIFEPAFYSKPIVYGPWMFKQPGFHDLIQEHKAAVQIVDEQWQVPLEKALLSLLGDIEEQERLGNAAQAIIEDSQGKVKEVIDSLALSSPSIFSKKS